MNFKSSDSQIPQTPKYSNRVETPVSHNSEFLQLAPERESEILQLVHQSQLQLVYASNLDSENRYPRSFLWQLCEPSLE